MAGLYGLGLVVLAAVLPSAQQSDTSRNPLASNRSAIAAARALFDHPYRATDRAADEIAGSL